MAQPMSDERVVALQREYGLSYHVPYALQAEELVGLRGKRVLEVGGSLPEGFARDALGAAQWIAVEEMSYWGALPSLSDGSRPAEVPIRRLVEGTNPADLRTYEVLNGDVEDLPAGLEGHFDLVFSIAAFEHILRMSLAPDRMRAPLRSGGWLCTLFSPIWSAHDGHHLPMV